MVKIVLLKIIYCIGFIVGSFSSDVKEIGSSISFAVASGSVIENSKSFSHVRAKRALALLVPFDDEDESSEEHHKSKRCWRARPVQKTRLSIEPGDDYTEEYMEGSESGSVRGAEYNLNKLYDKKRSVEKLEDESYESRESHEDDSGKKLPYFKILPVKNHRKIIKQFLGTDREMKNDAASRESNENSEELILKKIKNHINSDDYNVLALVGKRANHHPKANRPRKYICYCREADCSGGNCQRMMYRPCSTCKNSGPGFIGMANNKYRLHGGRNDNENQEIQTNDARVPLKIQYPVTKNKFIEYPVNNDVELRKNPGTSSPINKFDQKNYLQQNLPATQDKRYQSSHEPPRGVLVNRNNYVKPLNHYGFSHTPISTKSTVESGISSPKIPENAHSPVLGKPASNEYPSENVKFAPDRSAYNQWSVNPYYPSIGNPGNSDTNNKNYDINRQNFFKLYQSNNRFSGPEIQFPNQGMAAFPQPAAVPAEFQARKNFGTMEPKMTTNLHPISNTVLYNKYYDANGFGWNIPNAKEAQSHPQLQHFETQHRTLGYQEKSKSSSIQDDSQFEFKADGYDVSTENNFDSLSSSYTDNYTHSSISEENYSRDSDYEDITEEQFIDDQVSIGHNLAHTEDHTNVYYAEVSDAPERYKLPLIPVEKVDPSTDPVIIGNKNPKYDRDMGYSIDETTFRTQLEQPENEQSNWDNYNDDTTPHVIIRPDSNEQASSTYNDQLNTPESLEDSQLAEAEPRNSDLEESGQVLTSGEKDSERETGSDYSDIQVITNGYFTSEAYDDFGKTTNDGDILVTEIGSSQDLNSNEEDSYGPSSENQMESGLQNENVSLTVDETTTGDYIGYRNSGSSSNQQLAHEELDEPSTGAKNRLLEGDINKIITVTQASSLEDDEVIDATPTLISNLGGNKHLQTSNEREYSSFGSAESNELNLDSNSLKSDEEIESSKVTEIFSTEAVGKKETDSAEYESGTSEAGDYYEPDSSMGEDTPIPNEENVREADNHSSSLSEDGNNFEESSRPKSIESVDDDSYLKNDFIEYSSEDSPAVLGEKKSESSADKLVGLKSNDDAQDYEVGNYKIDDEPADVGLENSPTKYFSPNDRVLEYIKKHSQNLVGYFDSDNDEQLRTQATPIYSTTAGRESQYFTPEIYHTKLGQDESAEQYFQGFNSGSESEEIITQPFIPDDHSNSNYKTTKHQAVKYSTESIGNDFFTDGENYSATKPIDESIATQIPIKDLSDYDYDSVESTEGSVLLGSSQELKLGLEDEKSGITHLQKGISNHNYYDYADSTEISRSTEESGESIRDYSKEILSPTEHTQYNGRGNKESDSETTSSYNNRIAGEKSTAKNYYDNEKVLDNHSSSDENMNTLRAQDYGRINAEGNSSPEMNSRSNSFDETEPNQYVRSENYATQSTTKNLRPDVGIDQNKFVSQQAGETEDKNHSDFPVNENDGHDADIVRYYNYNPIELQETSTETTAKNLREDANYYTTQATQYADDIYSRSSETLYKSPLNIKSEDNLSQGYKSKKDSGIINNVELVSSSQSSGCCTKPPEVGDDAGYLGRLKPKNSNANVKSLGDLVESDLYYIGDGVKLPLTIKKLKDGSFALSISDKICKHLSEGKCPCCVPREGRILQEKRSEESDEKSTAKNDISPRRWAISTIPDDEESEIDRVELDDGKTLNVEQYERMSEPDLIVFKKNRDHKRRATRSISMPVDEFAEKYNLILNLNDDFATGATAESSLRNNVIQRDQATDDTQQDDSDFIPKVVLINDAPKSERASLLLSTLQELIETEPKDAVNGIKNKLRGIKSAEYDQEEGKSGGQKARYGYQRDNPILDRIRIIKQLQNKANRCEHRYQKDCNDAITQKTELLTMILNWLKDLATIERTYLT